MMSDSDNCKALLENWLARTTRSQELHYKAAHKASVKNYLISAVAIAGGISVALNSLYSPKAAVIVPIIGGVAAAFATAAQVVFRWANQADAYKVAAVQLGEVRRNIERALSFPDALSRQSADIIHEQVNLVLLNAPRIPFSFFEENSN
jgi:hypothetical protein